MYKKGRVEKLKEERSELSDARNEEFHFEFRVDALNVESYTRRRLLLEELESIPKIKVSAICESAAWGGFETHIVTVISVVANILTIANILHKHLRKTKKTSKKASQFPIVYILLGNEKVILNNMSQEEIIALLKTEDSGMLNSRTA